MENTDKKKKKKKKKKEKKKKKIKNKKEWKIASQMIGSFLIIEKVSSLIFKLKIPENIHNHLVFHVSLLESCYENEFPERSNNHSRNINCRTINLWG